MTETQSPPQAPDGIDASRELFERAREAMLGMFRVQPSPDPSQTVTSVTDKVVESQRRAYELVNGMADMWTRLAQSGEAHETWKKIFEDTTRLMSEAPGPDPRELYDAWRRQGERLFGGQNPFAEALSGFGQGDDGSGVTALLSSPGFGLTREYQTKMGALLESWLELRTKEVEYQRSLGEAWTEAFRRMTERMATLAREGKRFEKPRELLDEWVKVADEVFTAHFCSEGFCSAQAQLLNAAHRVRRQRRDLMEDALRASDLPTRSDLEEAHKMIYELRKELRGVERELDALRRGEGGPR